MNNEAPASTAALQARIADLEQQLKLSDEGVSRLAERCLGLEQEVQSYLAAHPQNEKHTDSPALLQPTLYFDAGFGFSEKDTLTAPDYEVDELTGVVIATFELPVTARALRLDPGELPCCITNLSFSDDRVLCRPVNGLTLPSDSTLFLDRDPNYLLDGVTHFPAGMKLGVSYHYCPLETLADKPLFNTVLEGPGSTRRPETARPSTSPVSTTRSLHSSRPLPRCSSRSANCTRRTPRRKPAVRPTKLRWKAS